LPAREVLIQDFEIISVTHNAQTIDVAVRVVCSAGTYIRALARDLGEKLGVGGHLVELRRTRSGKFSQMRPLVDIENTPTLIELPDALRMTFPIVEVSGDDVKRARNGVRIQLPVEAPTGLVGVFTKEGEVISLSENKNSELIPLVVFQVDQ
jgi:tRNA pseudouridine55 synthase